MKRFSAVTFLTLGGAVALNCLAADVTVRVVHGKTGEPLVKYSVKLYADDPILYPRENIHLLTKGETGQDGTVVFDVEEPLPKNLFIDVGEPGRSFACSTNYSVSTEDVLRSGMVTYNRCDRKHRMKQQFSAKPGEVVLFERKFTGWDLFRQEFPLPFLR